MKLDEVYEILNKIHDNQDVVNFESLIKLITNCKEIKIVRPRIVYGEDIFEQYVYKIEIKINNIDCNLWLYFYDEDNVTIQSLFSEYGDNFIVQKRVQQHPFLSSLKMYYHNFRVTDSPYVQSS